MFKNKIYFLFLGTIAFLYIQGCKDSSKEKTTEGRDELVSHIDSTISPADDFYLYANNGWFNANPIPASENSNGIFKIIQDTVDDAIKKICEQASQNDKNEKGSNLQKIGDFYFSGMDTNAIEKAGISPLDNELKKIDNISNINDFILTLAHLRTIGSGGLFGFYIAADDKISNKNAIFLGQGGLGLPDRDYYFNTDSRTVSIREGYVKHLAKMFELTGSTTPDAEKMSKSIMDLETKLAKASRKLEDLRDPYKNYNKMPVASLGKLTPSVNWSTFFNTLGLKNVDTVIVGQPEFFSAIETNLKKTALADWKLYLKWNLINDFADNLNKAIVDQNFNFYGTLMTGTKEQRPRWKKMVGKTDQSLGDLIGQVYVADYLPKGSKEKLLEIGENIRTVFAEHIKNLDWMSDSTKTKALSKLKKVIMKAGYPDKWKDMSSVEISRSSFIDNVISTNAWRFNYMINKFGNPVDRSEWSMEPQTYNAYYNPSNNEIVLPACNIIVPGYKLADDAILYGLIGASTIGHEITHGFDDQGSQYDENGNLNNWWTKEDKEKFDARTKRIVEQFNNYKVLDSLHINGSATQGENIADLGGVVMGYEAFKKTKQGQGTEKIGGMTPDQRFFLGYAYSWMLNRRPESLAKQIMTDVHSPSQFRIVGPVSNVPEFYAAFGVKEGDRMYRPDSVRVKIW